MVSDGEDTSSSESAVEVLAALQRDRIVVDSVQVGPTVDPALHGISVVTGVSIVFADLDFLMFSNRWIPLLPPHIAQ